MAAAGGSWKAGRFVSGGARVDQPGTTAQVGDYVQEGSVIGRVATIGSLGRVPMLRLTNGLYVSQKYSRVIAARSA